MNNKQQLDKVSLTEQRMIMAALLCCICAFLVAVVSFPSNAAPPVPPNKKERLNFLEEEMKRHKNEKRKLERQAAKTDKDLATNRKKMLSLAKAIQKNEQKFGDISNRLERLTREKTVIEDDLNKQRKNIADLMIALKRLRETPPEVMIASPEAPLKLAQSSLLMRRILPVIDKKTKELRVIIERLEEVESQLEEEQSQIVEVSESLQTKRQDLKSLISEQEELSKQTRTALNDHEKRIKKMGREAQSIQQLLIALKKEAQRPTPPTPQIKKEQKFLQASKNSGQFNFPVAGHLKLGFNQKDAFGAPSQGIRIESVHGALVTSPMNGVVRFSGPFKDYGKMLIIEHPNKMHSLIAGLSDINTHIGATVNAGEPLGTLKNTQDQTKPQLYFELREDGKPIDPEKRFAKFSS